jgi:tetratricopeptide (TPR) repeat protein
MDSGVVQRLITKPWDVSSLRATLREVAGLPPLAKTVTPPGSGPRPVTPSGTVPTVDPRQAVLVVSREPEFHLRASTTVRQQGMTVKLMENVGLALTELRERTYSALVLDEELPLASLILATYNQLKVAPRLVLIRSAQRKNEPAQTSRVLCKPVTAEALAPALAAPQRTGGARISRSRLTPPHVPLAGMLAELEERMRKAEELARSAQREMEKGAEGNLARALADATLAATLAPKRDDFQELRRQLLGSVNLVRARESYARAKALNADGQTEAALQELERAVERDPRAEHLVAAGELWLKLCRELPRARQFAQLALVLEPGNGRARSLFVEVSRAMGMPQAASRLE